MKNNSPLIIAALTICTLCAVVLVMRFWPENWPACGADECNVQSWMSATSGYAAIIAAAVGVFLTWGQLSETRKQTAFLLGDALPSLSLIQTADHGRPAVFQLLNWNRRLIAIQGAWLDPAPSTSGNPPQPRALKISPREHTEEHGRVWMLNPTGRLDVGIGIGGWIDRQSPPPGLCLQLLFEEKAFAGMEVDHEKFFDVVLSVGKEDDTEGRHRVILKARVSILQICPVRREYRH